MDVLAREFRAEAARAVASAGLGDPKISYTIPEFCAATGIGRTRIYAGGLHLTNAGVSRPPLQW